MSVDWIRSERPEVIEADQIEPGTPFELVIGMGDEPPLRYVQNEEGQYIRQD